MRRMTVEEAATALQTTYADGLTMPGLRRRRWFVGILEAVKQGGIDEGKEQGFQEGYEYARENPGK